MMYPFTRPLVPPSWPEGIRVEQLDPSRSAEAHALLVLGYANGGWSVDAYPHWWAALTADAEYDPQLCIVAATKTGEVVGLVQCWTSAFIKDFAVHPSWRRRGVGEALLRHVFGVFQARGASSVALKVTRDNPSGAMRLYEKVGMLRAPETHS